MRIRELAVVLLAGTALTLSATSQEVAAGAVESYAMAAEGDVSLLIPLQQFYGVHAFFNEPGNEVQIQLLSEYAQHPWQNYPRFQKGSIVPCWDER